MEEKVQQAYWICLTYVACRGIRKSARLNDALTHLDEHRDFAYWLLHDLLDILDLPAPDCQDWLDANPQEERQCILEVMTQPEPFSDTCWYWLDRIFNEEHQ